MTRGKGEGSVYRRADGYWVGQVEAGRYPNGKRKVSRVVRRYKNGEDGVLAALDELRRTIKGGVVPDNSTTVAAFLDFWIEQVVAPKVTGNDGEGLTAGTLREYRARLERVKPLVGHYKLGKLTPPHVQVLANQLAEKYAATTRRYTLNTFSDALSWAVSAGRIPTNPAGNIQTARTKSATVDDALSEDESKAALKAAEPHPLFALFWVALYYGLRVSEVCNLAWPDVDFVRNEMTVRKSKTDAGVRALPLTEEAAAVLKAHARHTFSVDGPVFLRPDGKPMTPAHANQEWSDLLAKAGVSHKCRRCGTGDKCYDRVRRFHATRHTAGTLMLNDGVSLEVVSAILGHASISITADIYAKVLADLKRKGLNARKNGGYETRADRGTTAA